MSVIFRLASDLLSLIKDRSRELFRWLFSSQYLIIKLATVFLIAAIYLVIPSDGDLVILKRDEVEDSENRALSVVRNANANARVRSELAEKLTASFVNGDGFVAIEEVSGANSLEAFVEAAFNLALKEGENELRLSVNLTAILQAYITRYLSSAKAVHVMIEDWQSFAGDTHTITVTLLANSALALTEKPRTIDQIENILGAFLVDRVYAKRLDCSKVLCPTDLPASEQDVRLLARSLDALEQLRNAGACKSIQDERTCLKELRARLEPMTDQDDGGAAADFALFLVELRNLSRQVTGAGATNEIANSLEAAHSRLLRSRSESSFFAELTSDPELFQNFLDRNNFRDFELSASFINKYQSFVAGRKAMQQLEYVEALEHFDAVIPVSPAWFRPFLEANRAFAMVELDSANLDLLNETIARYESSKEADLASSLWNGMFGALMQRMGERFSDTLTETQRVSLLEKAEKAWFSAIAWTETEHDKVGYQIEAARTRAALGSPEVISEARAEIAALTDQVANHEGETEWRLAFMSVASWNAKEKRFQEAEKWIRRAVEAYPRNICAILNARDFEEMKNENPSHFADFVSELRSQFPQDC